MQYPNRSILPSRQNAFISLEKKLAFLPLSTSFLLLSLPKPVAAPISAAPPVGKSNLGSPSTAIDVKSNSTLRAARLNEKGP